MLLQWLTLSPANSEFPKCLTPERVHAMSRQPRLNIADGVYHVTQRGLEKRRIVSDDQDRREWLRLLSRPATQRGWRVFADALLDNHFHIFLRTPQPNLSAGMHAFESGYVTLFNKRHHRTGPLFQGRFGAVLVEFESHARVLSRYVHLNPVEAGLARTPGEYAWSSYRYYLDPHGAPTWLDWRTILGELSARESAARIAYRRFVEASLGTTQPNPLDDAIDGGLLGSSQFVERYQDACVADGCGGRVRCDPPTTARARAASEPCTSGGALAVSRAVARIAWSTRCSLWRFATQHSQRSVAEGCPPDGRERRI